MSVSRVIEKHKSFIGLRNLSRVSYLKKIKSKLFVTALKQLRKASNQQTSNQAGTRRGDVASFNGQFCKEQAMNVSSDN